MYEDGMDFDPSLDFDPSFDESSLSEQEMEDILGVEHVNENNEIAGLEEESEDPSLARLNKIKQNNLKKERAKKAAELKARRLAEEQKKRVQVQKQLERESYANNLRQNYSTQRNNAPLNVTTPSGGSVFSSPSQSYSESTRDYEYNRNEYQSFEPTQASSSQSAYHSEQSNYSSSNNQTQRREEYVETHARSSEGYSQGASSNSNSYQNRPTFESGSIQEKSAQRLKQFRRQVPEPEERRVEQTSYAERYEESRQSQNPLPFDTKKFDTSNAYAVESEPIQGQSANGNTIFEHTGRTPVQDSVTRNIAGTITDAGVFVGCDVIVPSESVGQAAFNSRKEESVLQPEARPAEDASRMSETVSQRDTEASSVISRRTSDYKEGATISDNAQMREFSQKEIVENTPKQADTSILYATSADMNATEDRAVVSSSVVKPSIVSGESEVQSVSSVKDTQSLLNRTLEGNIRDFHEDGSKGTLHSSAEKDAEGSSLESRSRNLSEKDVTLNGQKENDVTKGKEDPASKETKEGETAEHRKILDANRRKFARENGQMWKDVCQSSQIVVGAIASQLAPEDDAAYQAFQKGKNTLASVNNFLCYWGSSATYNMLSDRALVLADTANLVNDLCLDIKIGTSSEGKLNLTDLSLSKDELKEKLEGIEGLSGKEIKRILANKEDIKQMIEARQLLFDFSTSTGKLSEDVLDFVGSAEFFNPTMFSGEFTSAVASYFASSKDEMLRSINPANMTPKEIKKLLKMDAKNKANGMIGFSDADVGLLKLLQKQKTTGKVLGKTKHSHGVKNKMGSLLSKAKNLFLRLDDASADGLRQIFKVFDGGKTAIKMFEMTGRMTFWTAKFAGRIVFLNPVSRFVGRKVKQGVTIVKNTATTAIKSTKAAKNAAKVVGKGKTAIKGAIGRSKQIKALKSKAEKIKQVKNTVGKKLARANRKRKMVTRKTKKVATKFVKILKTPGKILFAPFNAIAKLLSKITNFIMKKILLPVAGVVAIILLIYMLLVAISAILISIVGTSETTIMLEPDDMKTLVTNLNEKTDEAYTAAKGIATGSPITNKVYDNTPLYAYGSPKSHDDPTSEYYHNGATIDPALLNGWHVYYLDSQGNVLGSNVSNVKDIISVACAMMQNQSDDVGEYQNLVNDMWEGMVPIIAARESDIYHTEYSTDKYPKDGSTYYCNNADFYTKYDSLVTEGVCFYDTVTPRHLEDANDEGYICTGKGCAYNEWDEWVLTHTASEHTHGSGCDNNNCDHSCDKDCCSLSHPHLGFCNSNDCDHSCDSGCCSKSEHTHTREGGCYRHDLHRDYYCPGHTALHCSYGYRDINVYITLILKDDVYKSPIDSSKCVIDYNVPMNYNCTVFEARKTTITFQTHWNGYKKRMKEFFNNGAWDWHKHSAHAVLNPDTGCMECNVPNVQSGSFNPGADASSRCTGIIEWADRLFNEDWFELYGVSVYSADSGLAPSGGTLTEEERQAILDGISNRYGDIDTARQSFVNFSLDYVGTISYWFGGKPSSKSWDSRWGTTAPTSDPYYTYNTGKGRTVLGLDCSGFVGWCYWNAFNTQPGCSTANFTTSLGLPQTSFMNLQPGDIGLSNVPGSSSNHIGIFVGFDENGKALWVHCNGSTANVAVNNYNGFRYYYKLIP